MPAPLSNDLRERIISYYNKGNSVRDIIKTFEIGQTTIYSLIKLYKETGDIKPRKNKNGRKPMLSKEDLKNIEEKIIKKSDITLQELKDELGLPVSISALCRTINNKLKLNYKKKHFMIRTKTEKML